MNELEQMVDACKDFSREELIQDWMILDKSYDKLSTLFDDVVKQWRETIALENNANESAIVWMSIASTILATIQGGSEMFREIEALNPLTVDSFQQYIEIKKGLTK